MTDLRPVSLNGGAVHIPEGAMVLRAEEPKERLDRMVQAAMRDGMFVPPPEATDMTTMAFALWRSHVQLWETLEGAEWVLKFLCRGANAGPATPELTITSPDGVFTVEVRYECPWRVELYKRGTPERHWSASGVANSDVESAVLHACAAYVVPRMDGKMVGGGGGGNGGSGSEDHAGAAEGGEA